MQSSANIYGSSYTRKSFDNSHGGTLIRKSFDNVQGSSYTRILKQEKINNEIIEDLENLEESKQ